MTAFTHVRTRLCTVLLAGALVLATAVAAMATNGMQLIGNGPVMRSMGGAGAALPLDTMVISVNPAAMSELPAMVDMNMTYFAPTTDYDITHINHPMLGPLAGTSFDMSSGFPASWIPSLGVVYPVNDRITLGLAMFGSAGMGVDYDPGIYGFGVSTSFSLMKIVPAVSFNILDNLSIGVALNVDMAAMSYKAGGSPAHDKDVRWGVGFQAGIYFEPVEDLSFSVAYISRQWIDDFQFDTRLGKDVLDLDMPQQVIVGVGWEPLERLRLAVDLKWINWSETMGHNEPEFTNNGTGGQEFDMSWHDQFVIAVGAEFDLIPEMLKLRAGWNYAQNPLSKDRAFENIAFPALTEHHITAGLGFSPIEDLWLNVGFVYAPPVTMSGVRTSQFLTRYETTLSEYSIDFGLQYRF